MHIYFRLLDVIGHWFTHRKNRHRLFVPSRRSRDSLLALNNYKGLYLVVFVSVFVWGIGEWIKLGNFTVSQL